MGKPLTDSRLCASDARGCGGTPPRLMALALCSAYANTLNISLCPANANALKIRVSHTVRDGFQIGGGFAEANATRQIRDYRTH